MMLIWCQVHYMWNQLKTQAVQPTWGIFMIGSFEVERNTINLKHVWGIFGFVCWFVLWVFFLLFFYILVGVFIDPAVETSLYSLGLETILLDSSIDLKISSSRTSQGQWNQIGTPETSSSLNWTTTRRLAFLLWDSHCWTIRTTACKPLSYISDILSLCLFRSFRESQLYSVLKSKI